MDPNANLSEQQRIVSIPPSERTSEQKRRLSELRAVLKGWLRGGGFAPKWEAHPDAAAAFYRLGYHL